jgi:acetolactate synthase-1/3 small subunit
MRRTLSVTVENKPGVLARVAGLFARRGFNIDSLAVGRTRDPAISRMTIVVKVEKHPLEQVVHQLGKLVNVRKIVELEPKRSVERELMLIKVDVPPEKRPEFLATLETFRGRIVDMQASTVIAEVAGTEEKLLALIALLEPFGVRESIRTGTIALARGE